MGRIRRRASRLHILPLTADAANVLPRIPNSPSPTGAEPVEGASAVRIGTVMYGSPIPLEKWAAGLRHDLIKGGISASELQRLINLDYRSAWFMFHRIREGCHNKKVSTARSLQ